jgi:hypothetical protein
MTTFEGFILKRHFLTYKWRIGRVDGKKEHDEKKDVT